MSDRKAIEEIRLAPVREDDIGSLLPFVQAFYEHFDYPFVREKKSAVLEHLVREESLGRVWLIRHRDRNIGYVLVVFSFSLEFNGRVAVIDELFVEPSVTQRGVGTRVLDQVEAFCAGLGVVAIRLETEGANRRARALYARSGYIDHGRHLMTKLMDGRPILDLKPVLPDSHDA